MIKQASRAIENMTAKERRVQRAKYARRNKMHYIDKLLNELEMLNLADQRVMPPVLSVAVNKVIEGRPHVVDMIKNHEIALVINTVEEKRSAITDSRQIRISALASRVTTYTTIAGAEAAVEGMRHLDELRVYDLQGLHKSLN